MTNYTITLNQEETKIFAQSENGVNNFGFITKLGRAFVAYVGTFQTEEIEWDAVEEEFSNLDEMTDEQKVGAVLFTFGGAELTDNQQAFSTMSEAVSYLATLGIK